jgi:hypothetical protein
MGANSVVSGVFGLTLDSLPLGSFFQDVVLTFGGQILPGPNASTGTIGISVSPDGTNYSPLTTVNLTTLDTLYTVALPAGPQNNLFVKFDIGNTASPNNFHLFDNVAFNGLVTIVPEPGTLLLLFSGLAGLAVTGRRSA